MLVKLFLKKTVDQNAAVYFEKAKKARGKMEGARNAIEKARKQLLNITIKEKKMVVKRTRGWYEKFHWFVSSEGFLCVGGRDATTNDILVKKHMDEQDLVFHTTMAGSPFFIVKGGKECGEDTKNEVACATASYSKAWKLGLASADVFYCTPDKVSLTPRSGEYLPRGSFMIYGKTTTLHPRLEIAIGISDKQIIGGPPSAIMKLASLHVVVRQGKFKKSDLAKKVQKKIGGELDDIMSFLPGDGEIEK